MLARVLLRAFQDAVSPPGWASNEVEKGHSQDLLVQMFTHAGQPVRGLGTAVDLKKGDLVFEVPKELTITGDAAELRDSRFDRIEHPWAKIAIWLAEKKQELGRISETSDSSPRSAFVTKFIESMPAAEEFRAAGLAIFAPERDLKRIAGLPHLGVLKAWTEDYLSQLKNDLAEYNSSLGAHTKLDIEDALWGAAVTDSRNFSCFRVPSMIFGLLPALQVPEIAKVPALVPIGDMMNDMGDLANVSYACKNGKLRVEALQNIRAGSELTINYLPTPDTWNEFHYLHGYGMEDNERSEASNLFQERMRWSNDTCEKIESAHLGEAADGAFLQKVQRFAKKHCPHLKNHRTQDVISDQTALYSHRVVAASFTIHSAVIRGACGFQSRTKRSQNRDQVLQKKIRLTYASFLGL